MITIRNTSNNATTTQATIRPIRDKPVFCRNLSSSCETNCAGFLVSSAALPFLFLFKLLFEEFKFDFTLTGSLSISSGDSCCLLLTGKHGSISPGAGDSELSGDSDFRSRFPLANGTYTSACSVARFPSKSEVVEPLGELPDISIKHFLNTRMGHLKCSTQISTYQNLTNINVTEIIFASKIKRYVSSLSFFGVESKQITRSTSVYGTRRT
jgi:hypothetical protein